MAEYINTRSSLILKLTKNNVEAHNVDEPLWAISRYLNDRNSNNEPPIEDNTTDDLPHPFSFSREASKIDNNKENTDSHVQQCSRSNEVVSPPANYIQNSDKENSTDQLPECTKSDEFFSQPANSRENYNKGSSDKHNQLPQYSKSDAPWQTDLTDQGIHDEIASPSNKGDIVSDSSSSTSRSEPFGSGSSIQDPDYKATSSSESEDQQDNAQERQTMDVDDNSPAQKKGKKRYANPIKWKRNLTKRLRNSGKSYQSLKVTRNEDGSKTKTKVTRPAKSILPPCDNVCRLKCTEKLTQESRECIFKEYWELKDLQRQRDFIAQSISVIAPKYTYSNLESRRRQNHAFYFEFEERKVRVCRKFFVSTLGITLRTLRTVIEKQESYKTHGIIQSERRGKHNNHASVDENVKLGIKKHIESIPKVESHYCRADTKRDFIEGSKTLADIHRDYKVWCQESNIPAASYRTYYDIFTKEYNIGFYFPKKDQCDLCTEFRNASDEAKKTIQERYDKHLKEKDLSRKEKEIDKLNNKYVTFYDLQATLPCPVGQASSFYYVSKLNVYNLTFVCPVDNSVTCFVWHEGEAKRGANEVGSCVIKYLKKVNEKAVLQEKMVDIIFYTDNCSGQNKNKYLFALYLYAVSTLSNINAITHKYLIRGHTQNDADNVHSVIERQINRYKKAAAIYAPDQYVTLIRQAKKTGQAYQVEEMTHEDFLDLKDLAKQMKIKESYKNENGGLVKTSDIKMFEVRSNETEYFFYKNSYKDESYQQAKFFSRTSFCNFDKLVLKKEYNGKVGITEAKKTGILGLIDKNIVPRFYLNFYNSL